MDRFEDFLEIDGRTVKRVIIPEDDPKVGVIVATEYYVGDLMIRRDVNVEVSQQAFLAGTVNL